MAPMSTPTDLEAEIQAFSNDLTRQDDLGSVLRAHIRIENQLIRLIENLAFAPQHLSRLQLEYDQYVTMALVLGLRADWVSPLRAIGRLRNSFAHKLEATLDAGTVNNLYESLPADGKAQVHTRYATIRNDNPQFSLPDRLSDAAPKDRFQLIALILWTRLTAWLLQAEANRVHDRPSASPA